MSEVHTNCHVSRSIKGQVFTAIGTLISYPWISLRERMSERRVRCASHVWERSLESSHVLNFIIMQYLYRKQNPAQGTVSSAAHGERIVQILAPIVGRQYGFCFRSDFLSPT